VRSFYTDTVTRLRPQRVADAHNTVAVPNWTVTPTSASLSNVRFQMVGTDDEVNLRFGVEVTARLFGSSGIDIDPADRIQYGGVTYEVVGEPLIHRGPTGVASHSETRLRVFSG